MVGVRRGLAVCLVGVVALLAVLDVGPTGWCVGLACAVVLAVAAGRRATVDGVAALGPADLVTLTRATLACGIAALVAEAFTGAVVVGVLVPLAVVALVLDLVDGRVARRTGTASAYGARLDGEADAFLILVLSVLVAREHGAWVLGLGVIRYAYAVAARLLPWMQRPLPPRYWRKVVAAYVGIALTLAASGLAPAATTYAVLVVAAAAARRVVRLGRGVAVAAPTEPGGHRGRTPCKGPRTRQVSGMRVIAALSVLVSAAVHLYLWLDFARDDDFLGPSFMLNAIAGAVIAVLLRGVAALGAGVPRARVRGEHAAGLRARHDGRAVRRHRELDRMGGVGRGRGRGRRDRRGSAAARR